MILVLHTTARYLAVATMVTGGTVFAGVLVARRLCKVTPEMGERILAHIAEQLAAG